MKSCFDDPRTRTAEAQAWLAEEGIDELGYVTCVEPLTDVAPYRVAVTFTADADGKPTRDTAAIAVDRSAVRTVVVERTVGRLLPALTAGR